MTIASWLIQLKRHARAMLVYAGWRDAFAQVSLAEASPASGPVQRVVCSWSFRGSTGAHDEAGQKATR